MIHFTFYMNMCYNFAIPKNIVFVFHHKNTTFLTICNRLGANALIVCKCYFQNICLITLLYLC